MMKIQEIRELIKLIDESSIDEFKFEQNGSKVTMKKYSEQPLSQNVSLAEPVKPIPSEVPQAESPVKQEAVEKPAASEPAAKNDEKTAEPDENLHTITSPMVGTFYEAPSPDSSAYVKKGDKVNQESVVCIVEAMKLMNEIESEVNGEIVDILVENGQLVEYGQELFLVKPE
ncbi:acetyl-CoA carboxylase biotin carboxyl carrier protein [Salipaludibacillus sp. CUR1]|uniref:acetyl-CoA carboxylase biotin carboxyl carrier protein n=1 Tax=Salipaludibacillus sp. CUR1 TaxID=2820003 RepID=UPI001E398A42|nr:acetyl-CoA carboxylase biotin carboxyl carrier protein [Salipaludibacillus sp. CUR1]MCE7794327.1 acetyl-CoA carboxylase biotin carboxyl carrier protein [Salipaludibacillus sp. CUR1]